MNSELVLAEDYLIYNSIRSDFDDQMILGDFCLPNLEGQLFVEYENSAAPMEEKAEKRRRGRPRNCTTSKQSFQERKNQINQRERKRMKDMSRYRQGFFSALTLVFLEFVFFQPCQFPIFTEPMTG